MLWIWFKQVPGLHLSNLWCPLWWKWGWELLLWWEWEWEWVPSFFLPLNACSKMQPAPGRAGSFTGMCFNCNQTGHIPRNCTSFTRQNQRNSRGKKPYRKGKRGWLMNCLVEAWIVLPSSTCVNKKCWHEILLLYKLNVIWSCSLVVFIIGGTRTSCGRVFIPNYSFEVFKGRLEYSYRECYIWCSLFV